MKNNKVNLKRISIISKFYWLSSIVIFSIAIIANLYFSHIPVYLRLLIGIFVFCFLFFLIIQTIYGAKFFSFLKVAKNELRLVNWPNRQNTIQMTVMIAIITLVLAMLIFVFDKIILWLISNIATL